MSGTLTSVNSIAELEAVVANNDLVVVDFTATWCGPCRMIAPVLAALDEQYPDITVVSADEANMGDAILQYGVMSFPTVIFLKNGQVTDRFSGAKPKAAVSRHFETLQAA